MRPGGGPFRGVSCVGELEDADRGGDRALELRLFLAKLLAASGREFVVSRFPAGGRLLRFGRDPAFHLHPLEGGVERTFLDLQRLTGQPLDVLGNSVAVEGAGGKRFEDEEVQRASEDWCVSGVGVTHFRSTLFRSRYTSDTGFVEKVG